MHALIFLMLHGIGAQQAATAYVDKIEPLLQRNRDAFLRGAHTPQRQKEALAVFDKWWTWLHSTEGCGDPMMDEAGTACLAERERTGHWPWEKYYRDSIASVQVSNPEPLSRLSPSPIERQPTAARVGRW